MLVPIEIPYSQDNSEGMKGRRNLGTHARLQHSQMQKVSHLSFFLASAKSLQLRVNRVATRYQVPVITIVSIFGRKMPAFTFGNECEGWGKMSSAGTGNCV
jgi:hypothetical protein